MVLNDYWIDSNGNTVIFVHFESEVSNTFDQCTNLNRLMKEIILIIEWTRHTKRNASFTAGYSLKFVKKNRKQTRTSSFTTCLKQNELLYCPIVVFPFDHLPSWLQSNYALVLWRLQLRNYRKKILTERTKCQLPVAKKKQT